MTSSASFLEAWLAQATSVAYARFTADGILTGANARFLEIVEGRLEKAPLPELVIEGQRHEMARLLQGGELPGEPSFVHFAVGDQTPTTLVVTWTRDQGELVLIGESSVADMETTEALLDKLNRRVSDLARENVKKSARLDALNRELKKRIVSRTLQRDAATKELEAFAYSVAHDVRTPLRAIDGFSAMVLADDGDALSAASVEHLQRARQAAQRMAALLDDVLGLSQVSRRPLQRAHVDMTALAREVEEELREESPGRTVEVLVAPGMSAEADPAMARMVLRELLGNAWKFTSRHETARIEVGELDADGSPVFWVRDDGAGFDMRAAAHLFSAFQRLHDADEFEGHGIGLATVQRLVMRHGGRVWAEAEADKGATFYFTLSDPISAD